MGKMKKIKVFALVFSLVLFASMALACGSGSDQGSGNNNQAAGDQPNQGQAGNSPANDNEKKGFDQTLKIGMIQIEDNIPFYIAEETGLLADAGLKIEMLPFSSAVDINAALQAGEIDGEITDMIVAGLLKASGAPVQVISAGQGGSSDGGRFALLSSPKSGITEMSQLAGGTLGISENTVIEYMADEMMDYYGLDRASVKKEVITQIPVRMEALLSDQVSAIIMPDPLISLAEFQGANIVADLRTMDIKLVKTIFLFSEEAINNKRAEIEEMLRIYDVASAMINANPSEYMDIFIENANVPEPLQGTYMPSKYQPLGLPAVDEYDRVMDWMVSKGLLPAGIPYDELISDVFFR